MPAESYSEERSRMRKAIDVCAGGLAASTTVMVMMLPAVFIAEYDDGRLNPFEHIRPVELLDELLP